MQLITKENYLEIGHVECNECKASLDWDTVDDAIRKHGLITLFRESDESAYFGYTCPHCIKTSLHETDKEFLQFQLYQNMNRFDSKAYIFQRKDKNYKSHHTYHLAYLSNIEKRFDGFDFPNGIGIQQVDVPTKDEIGLKLDIKSPLISMFHPYAEKRACLSSKTKNKFAEYFCSVMPNSLSIEPIAIIQYFLNTTERHSIDPNEDESIEYIVGSDDVIDTCLTVENRTGIKIFNRYVFFDPVYSLISEFYIKHRKIHDKNNYIRVISSKENHLKFVRLFDKFHPDHRPREKGMEFDLRDRFDYYNSKIRESATNPQKQILKNANLLSVLSIPYIDLFIEDRQKIQYPTRALFPTDNMKANFGEYKLIYQEIWSKFHDKNLQNLLNMMADNFLDDYFSLARRTDCSFEKIWELRHKYLMDIHDSIKSALKMNQKKQGEQKKYFEKIRQFSAPYPSLQKIITQNYNMLQIKEALLIIGKSQGIDSFLLLGETGTGKELFAKAIHEISGRSGAFIPINCAAIPEKMFEAEFFGHTKGAFTGADYDKIGFFEQADGGTIFLDEIGELNPSFQARLLRVLQEKEISPVGGKVKKVDFLLVSATNRDLREMIDAGEFREDVFQRINEYTIPILSLPERKDDIPLLAQHFIEKFDAGVNENPSLKPLSIENEALQFLENYHWRGNVRELERACKLVMAFRKPDDRSDVTISEFNLEKDARSEKKQKTKQIKKKSEGPGNTQVTDEQVKSALANHNGNKTKAAEELGVTYHTILRRSKKFDL